MKIRALLVVLVLMAGMLWAQEGQAPPPAQNPPAQQKPGPGAGQKQQRRQQAQQRRQQMRQQMQQDLQEVQTRIAAMKDALAKVDTKDAALRTYLENDLALWQMMADHMQKMMGDGGMMQGPGMMGGGPGQGGMAMQGCNCPCCKGMSGQGGNASGDQAGMKGGCCGGGAGNGMSCGGMQKKSGGKLSDKPM